MGITAKPMQRAAAAAKKVTVLGATGSIGWSTLDLIDSHSGSFDVEALTANTNVTALAANAVKHRAGLAVIGDEALYGDLKQALSGTGVEAAAGQRALVEAAERPADLVVAGIVGAAGLGPTLAAIRRGAVVALANKECLVCAGDLVLAEVERSGATLLPVDSEHNAIYQVFDFERPDTVDRIILTASGGPCRDLPLAEMAAVSPAQALAHPNWDMGDKISIDSATMMNKGLELIEASYLFPVPQERIDVLVHPQSVVHSLVSYVDGSVLAQLGAPDMRTPIAYALAWPDRIATPTQRLDLAQIGKLSFAAPDPARFPALDLARNALKAGGGAPTVLNAANEVAVEAFLQGRTGFLDIVRIVETVLEQVDDVSMATLADIQSADQRARRLADVAIARLAA